MRHLISAISAAVMLVMPVAAAADLAADLAGKTLVLEKSRILMGADGTMTGMVGKSGTEALAGTWTVEGTKLCRTITAPKRLAGSECQKAVLKRKKLTLTRADGSSIEWAVK